jgi:hypothetical protein
MRIDLADGGFVYLGYGIKKPKSAKPKDFHFPIDQKVIDKFIIEWYAIPVLNRFNMGRRIEPA